jgi:hypothetical protein
MLYAENVFYTKLQIHPVSLYAFHSYAVPDTPPLRIHRDGALVLSTFWAIFAMIIDIDNLPAFFVMGQDSGREIETVTMMPYRFTVPPPASRRI